MNKETLVNTVREMGIVGAGGAGFPTHVKLNATCDTIIANGAECEPLLGSDKYLMATEGPKIIKALEWVMEACGARRGIIALKAKEKSIITQLKQQLKDQLKNHKIELFALENFYPAGDEHVLVHEVTGRIVPQGNIPLSIGCIVENVETLKNIHDAIEGKEPVTHRYLTCTGNVAKPSVLQAPIGMTAEEIIEKCGGAIGGDNNDDFVLLLGGPMMGWIERDIKTPITKTTSAIIVLSPDHPLVQKKTKPLSTIIKQSKAVCCQCMYCTELCPRYLLGHHLEPHKIMRQISLGLEEPQTPILNAVFCSECGLCEVYACVMELSPRIVNMTIKQELQAKGISLPSNTNTDKKEFAPHAMLNYRKTPLGRLINRLHLEEYSKKPLVKGITLKTNRIELLLKQHIGVPALPVVKQGQQLSSGTLVAEIPEGKIGARIHTGISGSVTHIDEERIIITQEKSG